jgi:hypothetical protein
MNILIEVFREFEVQERVIAITSNKANNNISAINNKIPFRKKN